MATTKNNPSFKEINKEIQLIAVAVIEQQKVLDELVDAFAKMKDILHETLANQKKETKTIKELTKNLNDVIDLLNAEYDEENDTAETNISYIN